MTSVPAHALTNDEIRERIRRFKATGDEMSIRPVVALYAPRIAGIARRRAGTVDESDLESAGYVALTEALQEYDPESPVPFGAFFAEHHRAALRAEEASLGGAFAGSRKTAQYRGQAREAAQAVARGRTTASTDRREVVRGAARRFRLPDAFTDADLRALDAADRDVARTVLPELLRHIETHLRAATATGEAEALSRQEATLHIVRTVLAADLPKRRTELEMGLAARVEAAIATFCRYGRFQPPATDDYWEEVGRRARLSPENARALVLSSQGSVSLDAPIASDSSATVADRITADPGRDVPVDQLVRLAEAIDLLPPVAQTMLVLSNGLDGQVALTPNEIAMATGLAVPEVRAFIGQAKSGLQQPAVQAVLRGESPAHRERAESWRAALAEATSAWRGAGDVSPEVMSNRRRVRATDTAPVPSGLPDIAAAAAAARCEQGDLFAGPGLL